MTKDYLNRIEEYQPLLIKHRRHLHQHPELSYQEHETSQYIFDQLQQLKHPDLSRPTETSVLAVFDSGKEGPVIGVRADIDALAIEENRPELDFTSKNEGVMHACGHDGHTAIVLTLSQYLDDHFDLLKGKVYCVFQHAEETGLGGAVEILETGALDEVDFMIGQHNSIDLPFGVIDVKEGPATANTDSYEIELFGEGGHASSPQESQDLVMAAVDLVQGFQTIVNRQIDPQEAIVLSNTVVETGDRRSPNVIPASAYLAGSVRSLSDQARDDLVDRMEALVKNVADFYGVDYKFDFYKELKGVINDPEMSHFVRQVAEELYPGQTVSQPASLGGEDFSAYSRQIPSVFVWIGARNDEKDYVYPQHTPKYAFDEDYMLVALKLFAAVVFEYQATYS